jgi:catechol 2,3-dioxygenase-like lactoylglutathione lyase family enzyme
MKKRAPDQTPWMPAPDYGRSLKPGLGVNLLVKNVSAGVKFATEVLGATVTYADDDFAVLRGTTAEWMLHADHTYSDNPVRGLVQGNEGRGAGVELRLYGCDPDMAEAAARKGGWTVLAGSMDKPHGLRECVILDDEGYCWVPGVPLPRENGRG